MLSGLYALGAGVVLGLSVAVRDARLAAGASPVTPYFSVSYVPGPGTASGLAGSCLLASVNAGAPPCVAGSYALGAGVYRRFPELVLFPIVYAGAYFLPEVWFGLYVLGPTFPSVAYLSFPYFGLKVHLGASLCLN